MTANQYYALRVRSIYKSYPAYAPGQEPDGYLDSLRQKDPEVIFEADKLRTKEDWILAGKAVFESENSFSPAPPGGPSGVYLSLPTSKVGVLPFFAPGFR
jgi:hypothetical protein